MKMQEEQRKLDEEKIALEKERLRVYDSGISSRADSGPKFIQVKLFPSSRNPRA